MDDLFAHLDPAPPHRETLAEGAVVLRHWASAQVDDFLAGIEAIAAQAPFRHMVTPGGFSMSVAMTNCGPQGWVTDRRGYRYAPLDPASGQPWPAMPESWRQFAVAAAAEAGFPGFQPDACLINRYAPASKMALHQDKDEADLAAPIVSLSLGLPAIFQFGGLQRGDPVLRVPLMAGDVVVWGGPSRLRFHGILPVKAQAGGTACRYNLTFRQARITS